MSVDNWAICPKCKKRMDATKQQQMDYAKAGYGKLSPEEYETAMLKAREPIKYENTLREDYEVYMEDDGFFSASYSAYCDKCGFKFNFKHSEQVEI